VNDNEAMRQEAERLKRSIWFLLSFAKIAERTAHLPAPVRFVMLAILRVALGAGQRLVSRMAEDLGLELAVFEPGPDTDSIDELFELARAFRILGCLLGDLAAWAGYFAPELFEPGHERIVSRRRTTRPRSRGQYRHAARRSCAIRAGPWPPSLASRQQIPVSLPGSAANRAWTPHLRA